MKEFMSMLLALVLVVIFVDYSEAGKIISKTYDEISGKTIIKYEMAERDNPFKIYKEFFTGSATEKAVEKYILAPNHIINPNNLAIGTVLTIEVENLKADKSEAGKFASPENPKSEETEIDGKISFKEDVPFVSGNNPKKQKSISDKNKSGIKPTGQIARMKRDVNDLQNSIKMTKEKILKLEGIVAVKENKISALTAQINELGGKIDKKKNSKKPEARDREKIKPEVNYDRFSNTPKWVIVSLVSSAVLLVSSFCLGVYVWKTRDKYRFEVF